jgi:ankyrin repeat protein
MNVARRNLHRTLLVASALLAGSAWAIPEEKKDDKPLDEKTKLNQKLNHATSTGDKAAMLACLKKGADPEWHDPSLNGKTTLVRAILTKKVELAKILLDHGADVNHPDGSKRYPVYFAGVISSVEMAEFILSKGGDKDVNKEPGLLGSLCAHGYSPPEMIKVMVKAGADPNMLYDRATPLVAAIKRKRPDYVKALIEAKADVNWKDKQGKTTLQYAEAEGQAEIVTLLVEAGASRDVAFTEQVLPLLKKYCLECHSGKEPEGELRLDALTADFAQSEASLLWKVVEERVASRTMPPPAKPQPSAEEARTLESWINSRLAAADLARQKLEGRAVLRRLNRTEYENTVRSLLAIDIDLKTYLPEDNSVGGFDNVGAALTLSPVLLERYLEAADAALNAAIVEGPRPQQIQARYSFHDEPGLVPPPSTKHSNSRLTDEGIVFLSSAPAHLRQFRPKVRGKYRFRITARSVDNGGKPLVFQVFGSVENPAGVYFQAAAEPTVIEFEGVWRPFEIWQVSAKGLGPSFYMTDLAAYKGPGLEIRSVEVEGPILSEWPPESVHRVFGDINPATAKPADAERLLRAFMPRALRRPVTAAQIQPYVELVNAKFAEKYSFEDALRVGLRAVLCSPHFLFLEEAPGPLDDFALASRLSYFLWKSLPDERLIKLAQRKELRSSLYAEVERMLADPQGRTFVADFLGQWLDLRLIDLNPPDKKLYPEHSELLQISMRQETELFFEELLARDLSVLNFIDADFSLLNEPLAQHYRVPGVEGLEFRKVKLPAGLHRGGVLTQASVLKVTANGTTTSPVLRGVWVLKNILGQPVPPPPPNVPAVEPDIRGATTIREQLAKHRQLVGCAVCHRKIDPPGFALENFDVIGGWRENYRTLSAPAKPNPKTRGPILDYRLGPKVEAGDALPDGRRFHNIDEFKKLLLADPDKIARCLTEKLVTYATGTAIRPGDHAAIDEIVGKIRTRNYGLRSLIHEIVNSDLFLNK